MLINRWPYATQCFVLFFHPFANRSFLWWAWGETNNWACVTLIISLRWDSGSRPAMGRILIFCVLEQRSARDSVIFLWVALSVEWGLEIQEATKVRFKVTVHKFVHGWTDFSCQRSEVKATATSHQSTSYWHHVSKTLRVNVIRCDTNVHYCTDTSFFLFLPFSKTLFNVGAPSMVQPFSWKSAFLKQQPK